MGVVAYQLGSDLHPVQAVFVDGQYCLLLFAEVDAQGNRFIGLAALGLALEALQLFIVQLEQGV